jgi:transcriptional regulator with XRE-family HTH domain
MQNDHKKVLKSLGANIRAARLRAGLTLPMLSKLSGVSRGKVSKTENGGNLTALTLYRLCWSIGIHPAEVLPSGLTAKLIAVAGRLERRAREIEMARAKTDEESATRRSLVVVYTEIAAMLRAEAETLSYAAISHILAEN